MSKYQLAGQDEHRYHVLHPDGSAFQIAKHGIDQDLAKRIDGMPKAKGYFDGGEVSSQMDPSDTADQIAADAARAPASTAAVDGQAAAYGQAYGIDPVIHADQPIQVPDDAQGKAYATAYNQAIDDKTKGPVPSSTPPNPLDKSAAPSPTFQTPAGPGAPAMPQNPYGDPMGMYKDAMAQERAGIQGVAGAQSEGLKAQAQVYQDLIAQQQKVTDDIAAKRKVLDDKKNKIFDDITNFKVDPNRYYSSMSTGNKIGAGISVLLSGIGAGLSHQPNMALQVIDKAIDRDIDAQKVDLGKKQNLLSENLREYGDLNAAEQATRLQLNAVAQARISASAAQSGSKEVQARAMMGLGQLEGQRAQMAQQFATTQAQARSMGYGGGEGGYPIGGAPPAVATSKEYRETAVPLFDHGKEYQARTPKEAEDLNKMEGLYKPIAQDIDLLKNLQKNGAIVNPEGRKRAQAAMARLGMAVNEFNGYKRFTDTDAHIIAQQFNDPTSVSSVFAGQGATADTLRALQSKLESERRQSLLGYGGPSQYETFKPLGTVK